LCLLSERRYTMPSLRLQVNSGVTVSQRV